MIIRAYRESDREAIEGITVACFDGASSIDHNIERLFGPIGGKDWTWRKKRHIDEDIAAGSAGIFVAEIEGSIVGYITTRVDHETKIGWIPNIAVLPAHRKSGIGRALIEAAVAHLRDEGMTFARIETLETNPAGQSLYPACGFKEVARQIHYIMPIDDT